MIIGHKQLFKILIQELAISRSLVNIQVREDISKNHIQFYNLKLKILDLTKSKVKFYIGKILIQHKYQLIN